MPSVFLLYMPPGNHEAMVHYEDTIIQKVPLDRIVRYVPQDLRGRLQEVFGGHRIAVWGSVAGKANRGRFDRMTPGDDLLIVEGDRIKLIRKIADKTISADLSRELWKPLRGRSETPWELIYFVANPREIDVLFSAFCKLFGYSQGYQLRGFTSIADEKVSAFFKQYDDLYSVLLRLQRGLPILQRAYPPAVGPAIRKDLNDGLAELQSDDIEQVLASDFVSDHTKMQWKLAKLGLKAGEKVWIPVGDQDRLQRLYQFETFDRQFAAGIDLPHSYVENIDVVWKQEFRIDAAYEIENSTAIYSGLLRFTDLMILAPNSIYPMFIVAPTEKKNRVREQLRRPTFKRMDLGKKVRFLSYEVIDDIDRFFADANTGLNVEVIEGRSEMLV